MTVSPPRTVATNPTKVLLAILPLLAFGAAGARAADKAAEAPRPDGPTAQECALLDDPKIAGRLDGLLVYLAKGCGREAEFLGGVASGEGFAGEPDESPTSGEFAVSNPAQDTGSTSSKTQSETSIAFNPTTGVLCAAWNDSYHGVFENVGFSGFGRSTDGGITWTDFGAVSPTSNFDTGDPSLVWRKSDGKFYYAALLNGGLGLYRSDDDCQSFTFVSQIATGNDDKEIMAVDNNVASPYYGRLYVVWTDFGQGGRIFSTFSADAGATWSAQVALSGTGVDVQGAWPVIAPNGDVWVAWLTWLGAGFPSGNVEATVARSTNGGTSYSLVTPPMTDKTNPRDSAATSFCGRPALGGNIRYLPSPTIAIDGSGNVHVVYSYDPDAFNSGDESNVYYRRSTTQGASWDPEIQINDDGTTTDQWQPSLSVGVGNVVTVGYYSRQNDTGGNLMFDYYSRTSYDGGSNFNASVRMTTASSSVVLDPNLATCYHGDYDTQTHGTGFAHYLWSDDRFGTPGTPDIYSQRTPAGTDFLPISQQASLRVCKPAVADYTIQVLQFLSFSEVVTLSTSGEPAGAGVSFTTNATPPPFSTTMSVTTAGASAGNSTITVTGTSSPSAIVHSTTVGLTIDAAAPAAPTLTAPANGATNVAVRPSFSWSAVADAASYLLEVDDDPGFGSPAYSQTVESNGHTPNVDLPSNTVFYWRVRPSNACGDGSFSAAFSFTTVALPGDCSIGSAPFPSFMTTFENGTTGWTHSAGTGSDTWALSSVRTHSGTNAWLGVDIATVSDQRLVSPQIPLPNAAIVNLMFWNHQTLEDRTGGCYDGGILEISDNGGATWTQIVAPNLLTDPYDGPISAGFSNPLANLDAWCGDPQDWTRSVIDVTAWAGQNVQFRFRLGTDSSVAHEGWYLDDLTIQSCLDDGIFADGFEPGDTSRWDDTQPAP